MIDEVETDPRGGVRFRNLSTIDGERNDLALIDAVMSNERFVGARALLAPETLQMALVTREDAPHLPFRPGCRTVHDN